MVACCMKVNMLTRVNMQTKGGFRECALNRSIQLAKAYGAGSCQQGDRVFGTVGFVTGMKMKGI